MSVVVVLALSAACGSVGEVSITPPTAQSNLAAMACAPLRDHLPATLHGLKSRVVTPQSPLTYAWGDPPIRLRCGVSAPTGSAATSERTTTVRGVRWYYQTTPHAIVWTALRPSTDVAVVIPTTYADSQGAIIADLSRAVLETLPATPT